MLKDAYQKYRAKGFVMLRTVKHRKFSAESGRYPERKNEEYKDGETGYAAIVPPEIIIVDNDSYKDEGESFNAFLSDMGYKPSDIVAFAKTPSGGEHYAFVNPYPTKIIGSTKRYPKLDVFTGYQSVIPCVGTVAENKQGKLGTYTWGDDNFEEDIVLNAWNEKFLELFAMRERGERHANDYDDLSLAEKENEMPDEEVVMMIEQIPNNTLDYDGIYLPIAMALYDRYEGGERGLELFQQFCAKIEDNDPEQNAKKWQNGNFKSSQITYKRLRKMYKTMYFSHQINTAKSEDELFDVMSEIKAIPSMLVDNVDYRKEYATVINSKFKDLKKAGITISRVPQIPKILSLMECKHDIKPIEAEATKIYLCNGSHYVQHKEDFFDDLTAQMVGKYLKSFRYTKDEIEGMLEGMIVIRKIKTIANYLIERSVEFTLEQRGENVPDLLKVTNPLANIKLIDENQDILNDFLNDIWAGKIDDIIKIIALTIKFKETKRNRLMIVAPSDVGKSSILEYLGFQKTKMKNLVKAMGGDKGLGADIINGIRSSGLLLIDEVEHALPSEFKDMDERIQVDQFGSGGTQVIPLHFTGMTATHSTATSYTSDEIRNRLMQVELVPSEVKHTLVQSPYYLADKDAYTNTVRSYLLRRFKELIHSDCSFDELLELRERYKVAVSEIFADNLIQISEHLIEVFKGQVTTNGEIILRDGFYYIKRKTDVKKEAIDILNEFHKTSNIDVGKYSERLYHHFVPDRVGRNIKIDGIAMRYYQMNLSAYYEDKEQEVIDDFDIIEEN